MTMELRDYTAALSSHPSGAQVPVQGEGMDAQSLPSKPDLDNGPWMELATRDLWDIGQ